MGHRVIVTSLKSSKVKKLNTQFKGQQKWTRNTCVLRIFFNSMYFNYKINRLFTESFSQAFWKKIEWKEKLWQKNFMCMADQPISPGYNAMPHWYSNLCKASHNQTPCADTILCIDVLLVGWHCHLRSPFSSLALCHIQTF